ncbi:hypothetical protein ACLOJK_034287 [Asimina triloba]
MNINAAASQLRMTTSDTVKSPLPAPSPLFLLPPSPFSLLPSFSPPSAMICFSPPYSLRQYSLNVTNNSLRSPSGLFSFDFYAEGAGFRVEIWLETGPRKTIVWTANRDDPPVSTNASLALTTDGLLLWFVGTNDKLISSQITRGPCSYASILDSGNMVLYDFNNQSIWEGFDIPIDTILGGQTFAFGKQLFSSASEGDHSTGRFLLAMQGDSI